MDNQKNENEVTTPTYQPRPLKVLLYSSDGYTESSVPALCLLMAVKGLSLPEAYLEMQVGLYVDAWIRWLTCTATGH